MKNNKKGFTLIELLIVIAIIAILAAIIFVAVDPAKRGAQSRDATRWSEVNSILNAALTYAVDEKITDFSEMGLTGDAVAADVGIFAGYIAPDYLSAVPKDPKEVSYMVSTNPPENNHVTVSATGELENPITVTR